jgi:hypothetical protein
VVGVVQLNGIEAGANESRHDGGLPSHARMRRADLANALDAPKALLVQEHPKARIAGIEEVAEHVHVASLVDGGHFDAINKRDPERIGGPPDVTEGGDGVVVRDAHHANRRGADSLDQRTGHQPPVGCGCMKMKIDQRAAGVINVTSD